MRLINDDYSDNHTQWAKDQILKLLEKADKVEPKKEDANFNWYLGGIHESDGIIIGKLGRVRRTKTKTFYDKKERDFKDEVVEDEDGSYSYFFIDIAKLLLIFERRKIIGQWQFINVLCNAYNTFYNTDKGIVVEFLKDETKIEEIIKSAKIRHVKFDVRPTNPGADEESKLIDEYLKKMRAEEGKLEFKNKSEGLDLETQTIASSAISLCNKGYGDYVINYEKEGEKGRVSSKQQAILKEEKRPIDFEDAVVVAKKMIAHAYRLLKIKKDGE